MTTSIKIKKEIYEVVEMTNGVERKVYTTNNLDDAVQKAKFYLRYDPTIEQVNQLKAFFRGKYTEQYTYKINDRTVTLKLTR